MSLPRSALREWAREHLKGVEGCIFPSFNLDFTELDEDGIRLDVRQSIRHGFFSVLVATETGLTFDEAKRMLQIVADEAKGKILVSTTLLFDTLERNLEMLEHAQAVGCHTVLLGYAPRYFPKTEDEIYEVTREMIGSTDLGVVLYPSPHYNFQRLHPSGFPPRLLKRFVDEFENVVAIKVGELGLAAECVRHFGNRILVNCPVERFLPFCYLAFKQQWIGAGCYEVFQSPEKPYLVEYFNLMMNGRMDEAMEIYWKLTPARVVFESQFNPTALLGTYNWNMQKYYQWCVGGNGGFVRQPCMKPHQHEMDATKMAYRMIGIVPNDNDEEFYFGKTNYAKLGKATAPGAQSHLPIAGDPSGGPPPWLREIIASESEPPQ